MQSVEKIAEVVLYEGYLLYPYRQSAMKNQQRWTFGGVYPRRYSEASGGDDPWVMQTQCLVVGHEDTELQVKIRYLHVVDRGVTEGDADRPVAALRVGQQVYRPGEEAIERDLCLGWSDSGAPVAAPLCLGELLAPGRRWPIEVAAGSTREPLHDAAGAMAGTIVRGWQAVEGEVELTAEPLPTPPRANDGEEGRAYRLTVRIVNTTPWPGRESGSLARQAALRHSLISTHTILRVHGGAFVSLLDPPDAYQEAARGCVNVKTWPVLVGEQGEQHTLLSSPIILYDYPRIAPESPGELFDATEIDELLTLSVMALTDEEKQEMRESDPRARAILERTDALAPEQVLKLHGVIRGIAPAGRGAQE